MTKSPHQLAEERIGMAEEYSRYSGILANLFRERAKFYQTDREKFKSDTATERAWELTQFGIEMTTVRLRLKAIEKQMSASNTMLRLMENEAKNLY